MERHVKQVYVHSSLYNPHLLLVAAVLRCSNDVANLFRHEARDGNTIPVRCIATNSQREVVYFVRGGEGGRAGGCHVYLRENCNGWKVICDHPTHRLNPSGQKRVVRKDTSEDEIAVWSCADNCDSEVVMLVIVMSFSGKFFCRLSCVYDSPFWYLAPSHMWPNSCSRSSQRVRTYGPWKRISRAWR